MSLKRDCGETIKGGIRLDLSLLHRLNRELYPILPSDYRHILANMLNFEVDALLNTTLWGILNDSEGKICAAIVYDQRDFYTRLFCLEPMIEPLISKFIDFDRESVYIAALPTYLREEVAKSMRLRGLSLENSLDLYVGIALLDVSKFESAVSGANERNMILSEKMVSDSLKVGSDDLVVDKNWTYHDDQTILIISESIENRPSTCVRDKGNPELDEHLVGWIIARSDYSLGSLRVLPQYRNQGLGRWISATETKKLLNVKLDPKAESSAPYKTPIIHAFIDPENSASIKLHQTIGFDVLVQMFGWGRYYDATKYPPPKSVSS